MAAGIIDGRNIWRCSLEEKWELVKQIIELVPQERLWLQASSSLLHVPVTTLCESDLDEEIKQTLAFADEKLGETALLRLQLSPARNRSELKQALKELESESPMRQVPFQERQQIQQEKWKLPLLPTTTIGSFPQTAEVRQARQQFKKGEWSSEQYATFIQEQIKEWIGIQEEIGLDVLVHGEFERTDMVEFFGEKLGGFLFTKNGWVQSYGSRCVKPPVIYGQEYT